jgi:hypothetical protein
MNDPLVIIELGHCDWVPLTPRNVTDRKTIKSLMDRSLDSARIVFNASSMTWMDEAFWVHYVRWCISKVVVEDGDGETTIYYVDKMTNKALARIEFSRTGPLTQAATVWEPRTKPTN